MAGYSIMDLGCGHGDLKPFLDERYPDITYLGVDFLPEFIVEAKHRYSNLPNTHFLQVDFLNAEFPNVDVIIASGSLNYRSENALHPFQTIEKMWRSSQKGIAFNLPDASKIEEDPLIQGRNPQEILDFCRKLDPQAELHTDYLPDDFAILMHH